MSVSESSTNWRISSIMVGATFRDGPARTHLTENGVVTDKLSGCRAWELIDDVQPPRALVRGEPGDDLVLHSGRLCPVRQDQVRLDRAVVHHHGRGDLGQRRQHVLDL